MADNSDARFEFRCWARNFGMIETRIRRFSEYHGIRESNEIYVVSLANNDTNIKIRDDDLELKSLIKKQDNLEQWYPSTNRAFPLTAATLEEELFPPCKVAMPSLSLESYTLHQFLKEIVLPHQELSAIAVFKRRFAFTVNDCMTELAEVWINGAGLHTVAVESTDPAAVSETTSMLGLDDLENVNYLRAIKRVIGMEPLRTPY
jgi:hypothetical protein